MHVFTAQELKDKSLPGMERLFSLAYQYQVLGMAAVNMQQNKYNMLTFNQENYMGMHASLHGLCFLSSLANEASGALYSLYGDFFSSSIVPLSMGVYDLTAGTSNGKMRFITVRPEENRLGVVIPQAEEYETPGNLQYTLLQQGIRFSRHDLRFGDVQVKDDAGQAIFLHQAIDLGIRAISDVNPHLFTTNDQDVFSLHTSYYRAYQNRREANVNEAIPFDEIQAQDKRPFYKALAHY